MNILIFGPNGSGKGAQSSLIKTKHGLKHIETGNLLREQVKNQTRLGLEAKVYMDRGELVPDNITAPMVLDVLRTTDGGWLLDGFPRNINQAETLYASLRDSNIPIDYVVELTLDRVIARSRILGRRICTTSSHHPNNTNVEAIAPSGNNCRICGSPLKVRADDQDESAINKRHDIYYDRKIGTLAAAAYFRVQPGIKYLSLDADRGIENISKELAKQLNLGT